MSEKTTAEQRRDALVERIFENTVGFMELPSIYIGNRLGLYGALADNSEATATELASATGTHERYIFGGLHRSSQCCCSGCNRSGGERGEGVQEADAPPIGRTPNQRLRHLEGGLRPLFRLEAAVGRAGAGRTVRDSDMVTSAIRWIVVPPSSMPNLFIES